MAYLPEQWEKARAYYEAGLPYSEIRKRCKINSESAIRKKSKAENWQVKNSQLVEKEVKARQLDAEIIQEKSNFSKIEEKVHNELVSERLKYLQFFQKSALKNQQLSNEKINQSSDLRDLHRHASITKTNKETVLGRDLDTQVNVQQNNLPTEIRRVIVRPSKGKKNA